MAFAATKQGETVMGNMRVMYGTFTQDGDTGGAISIGGLRAVHYFEATGATAITVDTSAGTATITTEAGKPDAGYWLAIGW